MPMMKMRRIPPPLLLLVLVLGLLLTKTTVVALQLPATTTGKRVIGRVPAGDTGLTVSQLGCGTWSWGNRLLWDYDVSQDEEIFQAYQLVRDAGVTIFDTADR